MADNPLQLIQLCDEVEAAAFTDMVAAAPPGFRQQTGLATETMHGATLLIAPGIPDPVLNRVIGLGNRAEVSEAAIDAIKAVYQAAGVAKWWLQVSPGEHAADLLEKLQQQGFGQAERPAWAKFLRGTQAPAEVNTPLLIRELGRGEADAFAEAICESYAMPLLMAPWFAAIAQRPGWRALVALDADRIMGGGLLHLQATSAWFGAGGVRAEARRQHAHRALLAARIRVAINAGCTALVTETGEPIADEANPSLMNIYACGFEKVASRLNLSSRE